MVCSHFAWSSLEVLGNHRKSFPNTDSLLINSDRCGSSATDSFTVNTDGWGSPAADSLVINIDS